MDNLLGIVILLCSLDIAFLLMVPKNFVLKYGWRQYLPLGGAILYYRYCHRKN